jgi:hypothetical protein
VTPLGISPVPGLQVDFDDVRLDATPLEETVALTGPGGSVLLGLGIVCLALGRRRR